MIPGMPQVGGVELLIVLAIILLIFDARRIPELGRSLGKSMSEFRKGASEGGELPSDSENTGLHEADDPRAYGGEGHAEQKVS